MLPWVDAKSPLNSPINPCPAEFIWENINVHLHLLSFLNTEMCRSVKSFFLSETDLFILHSQCHRCWWPGDASSQGIGSHGITLDLPKCSGFSTRRLNSALNWWDEINNSPFHGDIGEKIYIWLAVHCHFLGFLWQIHREMILSNFTTIWDGTESCRFKTSVKSTPLLTRLYLKQHFERVNIALKALVQNLCRGSPTKQINLININDIHIKSVSWVLSVLITKLDIDLWDFLHVEAHWLIILWIGEFRRSFDWQPERNKLMDTVQWTRISREHWCTFINTFLSKRHCH